MPFEALLTLVPLVAVAGLIAGAVYLGYAMASCARARMHDVEC
jgi:hypothetical protein